MHDKRVEHVLSDLQIILRNFGYFVRGQLMREKLLFCTISDSVVVSRKLASDLDRISYVRDWMIYGDTIKITLE